MMENTIKERIQHNHSDYEVSYSGKHMDLGNHGIPICPICRSNVFDVCIDCAQLNLTSMIDVSNFDDILSHKLTLLSMNNNSELPKLPKDVVRLISDKLEFDGVFLRRCSMVKGDCGHVYHQHCMNRWLRNRNTCPLDNRPWACDESDEIIEATIVKI